MIDIILAIILAHRVDSGAAVDVQFACVLQLRNWTRGDHVGAAAPLRAVSLPL